MSISKAIKQDKFRSNHVMMTINILYTHNWLRDQHNDCFTKYGIKIQHYNILRILNGRHPEPASPGEIKDVMLDKSPDLTRLIDKLSKMELVDRYNCKTNRRNVKINITEKGIALLLEMMNDLKSFENIIESKISSTEALELSNLLDKLRE
jgi:DNA-binding MarR family transcriptional regulator